MQTNEANTRYLQHLSTRLIGAQEEERRTVARELHDEVGQALTAVQVELSVAQRRLKAAGQAPALLGDAESITHTALQTVRDISQLLHPALLDDLGLAAAIEWQARTFEARHGIRVEVQQAGLARRLPREVELAAYRIVQESLTNVAKHSRASSCRIMLRRQDANLEIVVEDDGRGFEPSDTADRGLGLIGMRERAALLSGRIAFESGRGAGTRVDVRLPVSELHV
jgi:signal transduction histidine kinase